MPVLVMSVVSCLRAMVRKGQEEELTARISTEPGWPT
jgi:hypothetical protein